MVRLIFIIYKNLSYVINAHLLFIRLIKGVNN